MDKTSLKTIITDPKGTKTLVREAEKLGKKLEDQDLSTSQIRAIFGEVRQIQALWKKEEDDKEKSQLNREKALKRLILLKPKMAYRARKERGKAVADLVDVLDPAVNFVIQEEDQDKQDQHFERFMDFFEAILAYHKAHGGY